VRQAQQDTERVDCHVDLAGEPLHFGRCGQGLPAGARTFKEGRAIGSRHAANRTFDAG
jgi:hypothetical protein